MGVPLLAFVATASLFAAGFVCLRISAFTFIAFASFITMSGYALAAQATATPDTTSDANNVVCKPSSLDRPRLRAGPLLSKRLAVGDHIVVRSVERAANIARRTSPPIFDFCIR